MKRWIVFSLLGALLASCVVTPVGYRYRDDGYYRRDGYYYRDGHYRRYDYDSRGGYDYRYYDHGK